MMVLLALNVQDVRPKKIRMLIEAKEIEIFVLNETKIKQAKQADLMEKFGNEWDIVINVDEMEDGLGDTIWMGWNNLI